MWLLESVRSWYVDAANVCIIHGVLQKLRRRKCKKPEELHKWQVTGLGDELLDWMCSEDSPVDASLWFDASNKYKSSLPPLNRFVD